MNKPKTRPHAGLAAAVALAGSQRELAKIAACSHVHIGNLYRTGRGLPDKYAEPVSRKLGIPKETLMEKA